MSPSNSAATTNEWRQSFLQDIESASDTVEKGDRWVHRVLCGLYGFSLDDAIDATDCAGGGDHGVDGLIISEAEDENSGAEALVIQGKYGHAGLDLSPYQESNKFIKALHRASQGEDVTDAVNRCAAVFSAGGIVRYVIATVEPLTAAQSSEIDDVRILARDQFRDRLVIESVCLDDLRDALTGPEQHSITVAFAAHGVSPMPNAFVGVSSLVDVYDMMRQYADANHNNVDAIYDRNVRKWLKRRAGSVNSEIYRTLDERPEKFIAFNNGITLVCDTLVVSEGSLRLVNPYIVNGCQTTRTLYDFIETKFAGKRKLLANNEQARRYREAFLAFKVIAHVDDTYHKDITRYSNKQNALRGKDFLSLEDMFRQLHDQMRTHGYFLQVQAGEYDALPKHVQVHYPRSTHVIDAFDALRYYASAVLGKPHTAFGRSGQFAPEGDEFNRTMEGITVDDLLVPWLMAQQAVELGYSAGAKRAISSHDEHRNQTRYFYLYVLFHIAARILFDAETADRFDLYRSFMRLRDSRAQAGHETRQHPFTQLLSKADQCVKTYMTLARNQNWYTDRNSFLKSIALMSPEHFTMATVGPLTDIDDLSAECRAILRKP